LTWVGAVGIIGDFFRQEAVDDAGPELVREVIVKDVSTGRRRPIVTGPFRLVLIGCLLVGGLTGNADAQVGSAGLGTTDELGGSASMEAMSGMSPEEAAAALRARGLSDAQIRELMAGRVSETASAEVPTRPDSAQVETERVEQAPEELHREETQDVEGEEERVPFGFSLFANSPESYRQPAVGPVDPDYPLGPGDTIVLDVWGDAVFRLEREIDLQGGVHLPDVGRVVLAGMTLEQANGALRRRLSRVYSGMAEDEDRATTFLAVTLGDLRVIRAFVVGRARRPGGYDLSAASTVFHALFFAGGPTEGGSMRDIRVLRGGKEVSRLDVYEYLRSGRREGDIRLENDDTVFIPPSGPRVSIEGEVREPGIYELMPGETLASLVDLSGGFTERTYPGRIQIERILPAGEITGEREDRKILDLSWEEASREALKDGDSIEVFPIADRLRNFVLVEGEVLRPGRYELRPDARLSDLLAQAGGLLETAVRDRAEIIRTYEDQRREQISVDLGKALEGDDRRDLRLMPRDELRIHSIWSLNDRDAVVVHGAVRSPGEYELRDHMTLRDLLLQAGGLRENAFSESVEISRVRPDQEEALNTAEIFRVPLGEDYLSSEGADLELRPWDNVFVREIPNWELQRNVSVTGEVRFPGTYTLTSPVETISEVIARAGGLKKTAFPAGFSMVRKKDDIGSIALDLEEALKSPKSNDNVILVHGDSLFIPEEPKTVTVKGAVGWPTSLVYEGGWSIGDYVSHAGGTTEKADSRQIRVVYTTGAAARVKRFWWDPDVQPGSTIVVPEKEQGSGVDWGSVIRDSASVIASVATVALVLDRVAD
jgi:protein involved in polysaccharide export with SLBB domain